MKNAQNGPHNNSETVFGMALPTPTLTACYGNAMHVIKRSSYRMFNTAHETWKPRERDIISIVKAETPASGDDQMEMED